MKAFATTRKCFFIVLLVGIFVWLLFATFHPFEPRYGGKRLSQWASIFYSDSDVTPQEYGQATNAIQHLGTNALPYALTCCRARWFRIDLRQPSGFISADHLHQQSTGIFSLLGPAAEPAIPALMKILHRKNEDVVYTAISDLSSIGPAAVAPLVTVLSNGNVPARRGAAGALEFLPTPKSAAPALELCLKDEDSLVRENAALALGRFGTNSPATVVPALLNALQTETNFQVAVIFISVLGLIKEDAPLVVPAIMRYLQRETNNWPGLSGPIQVLGNFGTNAKPAVPALVHIVETKSGWQYRVQSPQMSALVALSKIEPQAGKPFVPMLVHILESKPEWPGDDYSGLKITALLTLPKIDPQAVKPFVSRLLHILESKSDWPEGYSPGQMYTLVALWRVDPEAVRPFFEKWNPNQPWVVGDLEEFDPEAAKPFLEEWKTSVTNEVPPKTPGPVHATNPPGAQPNSASP
ncbi:MAG TPA: HEAT repeat domain-containing protein [Candidatus Acidoferrales bacterium]|nr:HEAT repeat domain-containing protein [Candidatus Acidoferrales bacterium]